MKSDRDWVHEARFVVDVFASEIERRHKAADQSIERTALIWYGSYVQGIGAQLQRIGTAMPTEDEPDDVEEEDPTP